MSVTLSHAMSKEGLASLAHLYATTPQGKTETVIRDGVDEVLRLMDEAIFSPQPIFGHDDDPDDDDTVCCRRCGQVISDAEHADNDGLCDGCAEDDDDPEDDGEMMFRGDRRYHESVDEEGEPA